MKHFLLFLVMATVALVGCSTNPTAEGAKVDQPVKPVLVKYEVPKQMDIQFTDGKITSISTTDSAVIQAAIAANKKQPETNGWDTLNRVVDRVTSPGMVLGYTAVQGFKALQEVSTAATAKTPSVTNTTHTTTTTTQNSQSDSSVTESYGDYAGDGAGTTTYSGANSGNSGTLNSDTSGRINSPDDTQNPPVTVEPTPD